MRFFLSYARDDADELPSIKDVVDRSGHALWFDRQLDGGQQWWDTILSEIRSCDIFLFALSPDSASSVACLAELRWAIDNRRHVLPVMVRAVDARFFREEIASTQIVDFSATNADRKVDLLLALTHLQQPGAAPDDEPDAPPVPMTYLGDPYARVGASSLNFQEQMGLLAELRTYIANADYRSTALDLLTKLRDRPDVSMVVAREAERLIADFSGPTQPAPSAAVSLPPRAARTPSKTWSASGWPAPPRPMSGGTGAPRTAPVTRGQPKVHRLDAPSVDLERLTTALVNDFASRRYETQSFHQLDAVVIQVRSAQAWRRVTGAGVAFTVGLRVEDAELVVEFGQARWADKAAAAGVAILVAWPTAITAGIGAWHQHQMPAETLRVIEQHLPACLGRTG
jgi:TIR domain